MRQLNTEREVCYYTAQNGKVLFFEWLDKLKSSVFQARIRLRIQRLKLGLYGDYKVIKGELYELRFAFGPGYRVYFVEVDEVAGTILCAGDKSSQARDIKIAKTYLEEFNRRRV